MPLLPSNREHGWAPFVWIVYLVFFFIHPAFDHVSAREWVATIAGTIVFLTLYFAYFWVKRPWNLACIGGFIALGLSFAPWNGGSVGFFIYAACFLPFILDTEAAAAKGIALIVGIVAAEWWLLHLPNSFLFTGAFFCSFLGAGNIYFAQRNRQNRKLQRAQEEIEHLAKVAERERIARDLHDVLGHTLSVIILKSELAGKLLDIDPARARSEIKEVEKISRDALSEVRQAIGGYRSHRLAEELAIAKATLATAGIATECDAAEVPLSPPQEAVLALVVREAVTNVIRHSHARNCRVRVEQKNGNCIIAITDDGRGGYMIEGNGLRGMRERVDALRGTLLRDTSSGTRLTITVPLNNGNTPRSAFSTQTAGRMQVAES